MPRVARALADEQIYHIINRGNRRDDIFHDEYDFNKMLELLQSAKKKYEIKIYAYCLMSNHYHFVIYTKYATALSACMQWVGTSYVRYYNKRYTTSGHLWQGRYKSFIVSKDEYLLTLMKYVEANPLRAKIVKDAALYPYSSARLRADNNQEQLIDASPVDLPVNWIAFVNEKQAKPDIESVRNCIQRQAPFGNLEWQEKVAKQYGLESTLKALGRPRKGDL